MNKTDATIFIVDDDPSVRKSLLRLIRSAGWQGEAFASAQDFLARPAFSGTGCVVLDVRMPGMTGPELRDLMAAQEISLPVAFLTGHGDVPTGVDAMKRGAVDFLQKPVNDEALLQAIQQAVQRHAAAHTHQQELERIQARLAHLTPPEREVLEYVIGGCLNKQIAAKGPCNNKCRLCRLSSFIKQITPNEARIFWSASEALCASVYVNWTDV